MKLLLLLPMTFALLSCAEMKTKLNQIQNTGSSESNYQVGDVIEINHGKELFKSIRTKLTSTQINKYKVGNHIPFDLRAVDPKGGATYGKNLYMVKLMREVKSIEVPIEWNRTLSQMSVDNLPPWSELKNAVFGYKARVNKLSNKQCVDWSMKNKKCSSRTYLKEELEFVEWLPETKKYIESVVESGKLLLSKSANERKEAEKLALAAMNYRKSAQSSSDSACIALAKYNNSVNWLNDMKEQGVATFRMLEVANQVPVFKARANQFKTEYKSRTGRKWNRKCPKDYRTIVEEVKSKYGIFLL